MPRRLRIQYPGTLYHIVNRGNYRQNLFATAGAAQAFESTLDKACRRYAWIIHTFAIMRNHFHLALETPEPYLVDGKKRLEFDRLSRDWAIGTTGWRRHGAKFRVQAFCAEAEPRETERRRPSRLRVFA
jgi:REP element-mobilizing transposase RayT